MRRLRDAPKAPLAVAALLATPLFFASLMAFSLAVERPAVTHVLRKGVSVPRYHAPAASTEAKIWLLALVPSTLVFLAGVAATLVPRGVLVSALAAVAAAIVVTSPLDGWAHRHSGRFPDGADFLKDSDPSNSLLRGEWEAAARHTALSLGHWTIGLAAAAAAIAVLGELRRRRSLR